MISAVRNSLFSSPVFDTTTSGSGTTGNTSATPPAVAEPPKGPLEPSTPRTLPTNPSAMGRDEFLKMLVAQLKNQDPLNPMDGKDMAAQLAQFSTVEQLVSMNKNIEAQTASADATAQALDALQKAQTEGTDALSQLIEGQMAVSTVGKIGVTSGNTVYVDKTGSGQLLIDTGTVTGGGRVTITDASGNVVGTKSVGAVKAGQSAFDTRDLGFDPPLPAGKYTYKFEVATDGGQQWQAVKTYSTGRITGLKYDQGNPVLIIGDSFSLPMSQLIQIRG
jgi:flagellar basal-body rod modification protein FlgD